MRLPTRLFTAVVLVCLLSSGCIRAAVMNDFTMVADTPTYRISVNEANIYTVWATSPTEARKAIDDALKCKTRVCAVDNGGVIYFIEYLGR